MIQKYFLAALTALFLWSCNSKPEEKKNDEMEHHHRETSDVADVRVKELMAIHDSIMPAMGTLMDLKQKLSADIKITDSLLAVKPTDTLKKQKARAQDLNTRLEKADQEMMGWMHQYKADTLKKLDSTQADAYIADQKQKIGTVRDLMEQSIGDAQLYIRKKLNP